MSDWICKLCLCEDNLAWTLWAGTFLRESNDVGEGNDVLNVNLRDVNSHGKESRDELMFRSSCLNGRVLDFVLVALPLALVDRDLAAFDFHYVCAVIRADKNCINLAVETLVGDVDGWNHYPGFVKVLEKALDDDRLRMFED